MSDGDRAHVYRVVYRARSGTSSFHDTQLEVRAFTAADALTQVELELRLHSPMPYVVSIVPLDSDPPSSS